MANDGTWRIDRLALDRAGPIQLVDQIAQNIENAILEGALPPGSRLPSWRDLAAQLGVARGTVQAAYDRLVDKELLVTAGSAGTRVTAPLPMIITCRGSDTDSLLPFGFPLLSPEPLAFQMGIPAHDAFPATLWSRLHRQAVQITSLWTGYSDPRGAVELRNAIASHLALARGVECSPEQVIVTAGFRSGLAIALQAIGAYGGQAWLEDPCYPVTRRGIELAGIHPVAVPVDRYGLIVDQGRRLAPRAALAIVTPGQQAPTGVTLSVDRRRELLQWADDADAWIVEDDYLAELHLSGRSVSALASRGGADRVIHLGSFHKTISPMVGIGFIVAPKPLARRLIEVATWLGAPPNAAVQLTLADFLSNGHYLRHLRRMRRIYVERRQRLIDSLHSVGVHGARPAGLSVLIAFPNGFDDERLSLDSRDVGLAPTPLSRWYAAASSLQSGLLLGIANVLDRTVDKDCRKLRALIGDGRRFEGAAHCVRGPASQLTGP